ncbi:MAG: S41 family peptidase [Bacteroidales bacterium]|nr:S41 family peptidase [Bacteroidales bacterium]MCF8405113.1 S41 family peptidase [Bacteroidales bacterium]
MKRIAIYILGLVAFASCEKVLMEKEVVDTPVSNFENMWQTVNDKYSFFEYKNIDWDQVYTTYRPQVTNDMNDVALFNVLGNMLNELKDGHVNLTAPFDISRYPFSFNSPENFNFRLLKDNYIGWEYRITGSLINTTFERNGQPIGYIYYGSFSSIVENADIDFVIASLWHTSGIILDMRSNGGGSVSNIYRIGSRFADQKRLVYTSILKNGPGYEDFGEAAEVYMEPIGTNQYTRPVILLTNRGCYSATSFFTLAMKAFPHVIQVGDTTGGGLGAPAGFELPNGWGYRFSVSRTFSPDGDNWENGIPPDVAVWMDPEDEFNGIDTLMEEAIKLITQ